MQVISLSLTLLPLHTSIVGTIISGLQQTYFLLRRNERVQVGKGGSPYGRENASIGWYVHKRRRGLRSASSLL